MNLKITQNLGKEANIILKKKKDTIMSKALHLGLLVILYLDNSLECVNKQGCYVSDDLWKAWNYKSVFNKQGCYVSDDMWKAWNYKSVFNLISRAAMYLMICGKHGVFSKQGCYVSDDLWIAWNESVLS